MSIITVDTSLNAYLGLPIDYQIDKIEAFKLYQYFMKLFPVDKPVDHWRLLFYVDVHGDFVNSPKNKQDYVVKAIHENMKMSDQFETLKYIEYYNNTNGFKKLDSN